LLYLLIAAQPACFQHLNLDTQGDDGKEKMVIEWLPMVRKGYMKDYKNFIDKVMGAAFRAILGQDPLTISDECKGNAPWSWRKTCWF
jgi:hypothetical protein